MSTPCSFTLRRSFAVGCLLFLLVACSSTTSLSSPSPTALTSTSTVPPTTPSLAVTPPPRTSSTALLTYSGHSDAVLSLAWSPNGKYLASGSNDTTVQVWNATTGKRTLIYHGHKTGVTTISWSPDGSRIASGSGFLLHS